MIGNVKFIIDSLKSSNQDPNYETNNWEVLRVTDFVQGILPINENNSWKPVQVDKAIYYQTLFKTLNSDVDENTTEFKKPSIISKTDWIQSSSGSSINGIASYSSGFITSRGSIIPQILFPSERIKENGIEVRKFEKTTSDTKVDTPTYNNCFNWIYDYKDGEEVEDNVATSNISKNPNSAGKKYDASSNFTFVSTFPCVEESKKSNKKIYHLREEETYKYELPTIENEDLVNEPFFGGKVKSDSEDGLNAGCAFGFCYNFLNNSIEGTKITPSIKLDVGPNISFSIPQNGFIEATIEKPSVSQPATPDPTKATGSITTVKNCPTMGQLGEAFGGDGKLLMVYPIWGGFAVSGGLNNSMVIDSSGGTSVVDNGFYVLKSKDSKMTSYCLPLQSDFDIRNPKPTFVLNKPQDATKTEAINMAINWGNEINLTLNDSQLNFAYTPLYFHKSLKFSVFLRDVAGAGIGTSTEDPLQNSYNHFLYPIVCLNDTDYKCNGVDSPTSFSSMESLPDWKIQGEKISILSESGSEIPNQVYYKFDFDFSSDYYQRRGIEIFGFVHQTTTIMKKGVIDNSNGEISGFLPTSNGYIKAFQDEYPEYNPIVDDLDSETAWIQFANAISINRNPQQTGGNINIDKYSFMGLQDKIPQPIGEVRFKVDGMSGGIYENDKSVLFTGIAMELGNSQSSQSDSMAYSLFGIEKKLQDIKILNAPFFDGDPVGDVVEYLAHYANFNYEFAQPYGESSYMAGRDCPLPRSTEFSSPSLNLQMGMSILDALNELFELTQKTYYFDKMGVMQIMDNNIYGVPMKVVEAMQNKEPHHKFYSDKILSINLQPDFSNVYNQIITVALNADRNGNISPISAEKDVLPNLQMSVPENVSIKLPWSKMIVRNQNGFFSEKELSRVHERNVTQFTHHHFSGQITLAGNSSVELFDVIQIDDNEDMLFYIGSISHNFESTNKTWQTSLEVFWVSPELTNTKIMSILD